MRPVAPLPPALGSGDAGRIVLRDGTVASIRPAVPGDVAALRQFFHELSPETRRRRFFTAGEPSADLLARFCDTGAPAEGLTLLAFRTGADAPHPAALGPRLIALATYLRTGDGIAEAAFVVDDRFQGRGIGTALLERLAAIASASGFTRFEATTLADNAAMLEVFRDSGFRIRSKPNAGAVNIELQLSPSYESVAAAEARNRTAVAASIRPLVEPAAVAVLGASRRADSLGRRVFDALAASGFRGPVYPVNPAATEIGGRAAYASARALPPGVDLAVVAVPADHVLAAVDDCAAAGVRSLVVITAGFAETGPAGAALQEALTEKVRGYGMRMVGPNCMGLLNASPGVRLNASFSPIMPPAGGVAFSSQSGALGLAILSLAVDRHVGLTTFVSVGNKADVSSNDLLQYWEEDAATRVILLYLESFGNPRRFAQLARRIARRKPIVAVKAGRSRAGSRAAGSHTAALAASDTAVDALFHQAGVVRADTIDEMFDLAALLDAQPLPAGRRVSIVTNAGGPGILAVDACEAAGLDVVEFSAETRARLAAFLPPAASTRNPVDMVASAGPAEYRRAIDVALQAPDTDALIVIYTPVDMLRVEETLEAIRGGIVSGRADRPPAKPVVACVMGEHGLLPLLTAGAETVPAYSFPENAARALAKVARYAEWRGRPEALYWGFDDVRAGEGHELCRDIAAARGETWLTGEETERLLRLFGLPILPGAVARSADEAAALARAAGFPVVAKLHARALLHKTDVDGVRVGLQDVDAVRRAYAELSASVASHGLEDSVDGILVQPMLAGIETIIGVTEDPLFGPLVGFGLGGTQVEILGDVHFRVTPLTDRDADELLREGRGARLLQGYRGQKPADIVALKETLLRVSSLAQDVPEIAELDLNPVMALASGQGCRIVDARAKIKPR
ncbi:MAG TPA: GNAT family N-acetyltransferase [Vicinamibacterales bacterium]|nr:GNAT family N-acetyltransferase [Vicinamibacterales bacterium]